MSSPHCVSLSYNPFDPIQDTERPILISPRRSPTCYNPFDPIQDTESVQGYKGGNSVAQVTTHSIRFRILKVLPPFTVLWAWPRYNPFDPIQDTERGCPRTIPGCQRQVTTHSIRFRILKVDVDKPRLRFSDVTTHSIRFRILKVE